MQTPRSPVPLNNMDSDSGAHGPAYDYSGVERHVKSISAQIMAHADITGIGYGLLDDGSGPCIALDVLDDAALQRYRSDTSVLQLLGTEWPCKWSVTGVLVAHATA